MIHFLKTLWHHLTWRFHKEKVLTVTLDQCERVNLSDGACLMFDCSDKFDTGGKLD